MNSAAVVLDIGLAMGLILAPAVIGIAVALRCLDFPDLGIEASFPFGGAMAAVALSNGISSSASLILCSLAGAIVGALTAAIHVWLKVSKLLSGVIVLTLFYSVNLRVMGGPNISLLGKRSVFDFLSSLDWWANDPGVLGRLHPGRIIFLVLMVVALFMACGFLLRTVAGLRLQSVGSNPDFAASVGVPAGRYTVVGLASTNGLAGLAGGLLAMHQGFADVGMGFGVLVITIASMAIGERLVTWVRRWSRVTRLLLGAIIGSIAYQSLIVVALRAGLPASDLKLATAVLVLAFVAAQSRKGDAVLPSRGY